MALDQRDESVDILESLIAHPGWALLTTAIRAEWDARERAGRHAALSDGDDKRALDKLRQITAAQEATEWVLEWPKQELGKRLRVEHGRASGIPNGTDELLSMMSRRGSL